MYCFVNAGKALNYMTKLTKLSLFVKELKQGVHANKRLLGRSNLRQELSAYYNKCIKDIWSKWVVILSATKDDAAYFKSVSLIRPIRSDPTSPSIRGLFNHHYFQQ